MAEKTCPTCHGLGKTADTEPDKFFFIRELRDAVGLFSGAMGITPQRAWEEAMDAVRWMRHRLDVLDEAAAKAEHNDG